MTKNFIIKRCGVLLVAMMSMFIFSCDSDDESTPVIADLILKEMQVELSDASVVTTEFAEDGRPVSETNRSFTYDNNNRLLEEVEESGWFTLPTNYSYNNDVLVSYDYSVVGYDDSVSLKHVDITYNENVVTYEYEFGGIITYTFMSTDYKYLIKKEIDSSFDPNNPDKVYEYEYDTNFNLISVDEFEINPNTGTAELKYNYNFEYDDKKNPFKLFSNHNPLVFGFLRFSFDLDIFSLETATDPLVRRNGNQNIIKISRVNADNGNTSIWDYDYVYNADDYPTKKTRINSNGVLIFEIDFIYY